MKAYRIVWTIAVGVLVARGIALGLEHHPAHTGTALLLGAGAGAAWSLRGPAMRVVATALAAGVISAAAVGHVQVLGAGLIVVALVAVVTAPGFLAALERWLASPDESSRADAIVRGLAHAAPVYVPPPRRGEITDEQLWDLIDAGYVPGHDGLRRLDP